MKELLTTSLHKLHYINSPDGVYVTDLLGGKKLTENSMPYNIPRGYTMHEHLDEFGLINMNSRLYSPYLSRFLAPDPYIQEPTNSQNFNRYSYCLNNPLKYTDPSGEFFQYILGGIFGGIQGFSIGKNAGLTGWKLFGTTIIGAGIGAISGGIAADVTANSTIMANTYGTMAGSLSTSAGMSALAGANGKIIPFNMSLGFGSLSFGEDGLKFGFLGKKNNTWQENLGYGLGAMANISDCLIGFNKSNIREVDLVTLRKDFEGHSSIVVHNTYIGGPDDPCSIVSVGPAGDLSDCIHWTKGRNSWFSYSDHGTQKTILESEPIWRESIKVNYGRVWNYGNKLSIKELQGRLIYSVEFNSCVSYTSRALNMSGIFNIGIHPYNLAIQMWLRGNGFRPSLFSYYLKN